jgi:hypothetical protein
VAVHRLAERLQVNSGALAGYGRRSKTGLIICGWWLATWGMAPGTAWQCPLQGAAPVPARPAQRMYDARTFTMAEIAASCGVTPMTIYGTSVSGQLTSRSAISVDFGQYYRDPD